MPRIDTTGLLKFSILLVTIMETCVKLFVPKSLQLLVSSKVSAISGIWLKPGNIRQMFGIVPFLILLQICHANCLACLQLTQSKLYFQLELESDFNFDTKLVELWTWFLYWPVLHSVAITIYIFMSVKRIYKFLNERSFFIMTCVSILCS